MITAHEFRVKHEEEAEKKEKRKKKKKTKGKRLGPAPKGLVQMPTNPDKKKHQSYKPGRNVADFPKPFTLTMCGRPDSGKSFIARHIIACCQSGSDKNKKFQEIHVIHGCESTTEYDDIEVTSIRADIPSYSEFDPDIHTLLIFDDTDWTTLSSEDLQKISELTRFGRSHCNISQMYLTQSYFRLPKIIKDMSNVFVLFRPTDLDELNTLGRRCGLKKEVIQGIFKDHLPKWRNSLLVNLIPNSPYMFGKDIFEPLEIDNDSDDDSE